MYAIVAKNEKELLNFAKAQGLKIVSLEEVSSLEKSKENSQNSEIKKIHDFFLSMGIKPHYDGFKYLVYIFENNLDVSKRITRTLYPNVAEYFSTTSTNVERAIRNAIECAVQDIEIMEKYIKIFGQFNDHPTNHQFLQGCKYALLYSE